MGQTVVKNPKRVYSQLGGDSTLPPRVTILENNEYKITYYEIISGASGSLTLPTGATINAGEFGLSGNCILSKIDGSNKPTFESPKTAGGTVVTSSLNVSTGAWVASGVYTDPNVALIYSIKIKAINYGNLTYDRIVETVELTDFPISQVITNGVTDKAPSEDAVFDALASKLSSANNLSDLSNPLTARNNLGEWDLYLTGGDYSTTSNVASNITDLVTTTLEINKRYYIHGTLHIGCNNTGGIKFQVTLPTGATVFLVAEGLAGGGTTRTFSAITASATLTAAAFTTVNTASSYIIFSGEVLMGGTAGVVTFGVASGVNTQTSVVYQLGSHLTVKKIN